MALKFGNDEKLRCLEDVALQGPSSEPLCIGHKYTIHWWGAGGYVSDDGLVMAVRGKDVYFQMPAGEELATFQREGSLPAVMPTYAIPTVDLVFGYSLWPVLALIAFFAWRSHRKSTRELAEDAVLPVDMSGPRLVNRVDRQIAEAFSTVARPGEVVSHQGAVYNRHYTGTIVDQWRARTYFAFLTGERLVLVTTKVGHGLPGLFVKKGVVTAYERRSISDVRVHEDLMTFVAGGTPVTLFVPRQWYGASNQRAFARDLPRLLGERGTSPAMTGSFDDALQVQV